MKKTFSFPIENFTDFKQKMLNWVAPFNIFCLLDNHKYHFETPAFECLLAVGSKKDIEVGAGKTFAALKDFVVEEGEWLFGHLSYDLKNEMEQLTSMNFDGIDFPDCHFFYS